MATANIPFTGGGSTLTLATTGITIAATSIGGSSNTIPRVSQTDLTDAIESYIPGDVMDHDEVTVEGLAKMSDVRTLRAAIDDGSPTIETITVTDPVLTGESTASKEASTTAFITNVAIGARVNNEITSLTVNFTWGQGSTHTNGS